MAPLLQAVLIVVVLGAASYDVKIRKIPNWLNLSGLILGVGLNCFLWHAAGLRSALLGLSLALSIYFPLFLVRGMGAGDVKLMAAVGAIAGPTNWLMIFAATAVLGGLVALVLIIYRRRLFTTLINLSTILTELLHARKPFERHPSLDFRHERALSLPHGVMIAAGSLAFLSTIWYGGRSVRPGPPVPLSCFVQKSNLPKSFSHRISNLPRNATPVNPPGMANTSRAERPIF